MLSVLLWNRNSNALLESCCKAIRRLCSTPQHQSFWKHFLATIIYLYVMQCKWDEEVEEDSAGLGVASAGFPHKSLVLLTSSWKQSSLSSSQSRVVIVSELFHHTGYLCLLVPWKTDMHPQKSTWGRNPGYCHSVVVIQATQANLTAWIYRITQSFLPQ